MRRNIFDTFRSRESTFNRGLEEFDKNENHFYNSDKYNSMSRSEKANYNQRRSNFAGERLSNRTSGFGASVGTLTDSVLGGGLGYLAGKYGGKLLDKKIIAERYKRRNPYATKEEVKKHVEDFLKRRLPIIGASAGIAIMNIANPGRFVEKKVIDRGRRLDQDYKINYQNGL